MRKFKNLTDDAVCITGIPAIQPNEIISADGDRADYLARCPNLTEIMAQPAPSKKVSSSSNS